MTAASPTHLKAHDLHLDLHGLGLCQMTSSLLGQHRGDLGLSLEQDELLLLLLLLGLETGAEFTRTGTHGHIIATSNVHVAKTINELRGGVIELLERVGGETASGWVGREGRVSVRGGSRTTCAKALKELSAVHL